jgi:hypothetical protein
MGRNHFFRTFFLTLAIAILPVGTLAGGRDSTSYDGQVNFGSQLLHLEDGCLSVDGTVTSGNFFDGLSRRDIGSRLEYKKHGKVIMEYPESLTTSIRLMGDRCSTALSGAPSSVFRGDSYSLRFKVEWKDGMQLRPAALSPVAAQCVGYSTRFISDRQFTVPTVTCRMTIDSRGVPLGDHLIVSVFASDGTRLTRLSVRP